MHFTSIDLFSGAGGISLGLKWAKFKCLLASDFDKQIGELSQITLKLHDFTPEEPPQL